VFFNFRGVVFPPRGWFTLCTAASLCEMRLSKSRPLSLDFSVTHSPLSRTTSVIVVFPEFDLPPILCRSRRGFQVGPSPPFSLGFNLAGDWVSASVSLSAPLFYFFRFFGAERGVTLHPNKLSPGCSGARFFLPRGFLFCGWLVSVQPTLRESRLIH